VSVYLELEGKRALGDTSRAGDTCSSSPTDMSSCPYCDPHPQPLPTAGCGLARFRQVNLTNPGMPGLVGEGSKPEFGA
jgi:hypothetical protein